MTAFDLTFGITKVKNIETNKDITLPKVEEQK